MTGCLQARVQRQRQPTIFADRILSRCFESSLTDVRCTQELTFNCESSYKSQKNVQDISWQLASIRRAFVSSFCKSRRWIESSVSIDMLRLRKQRKTRHAFRAVKIGVCASAHNTTQSTVWCAVANFDASLQPDSLLNDRKFFCVVFRFSSQSNDRIRLRRAGALLSCKRNSLARSLPDSVRNRTLPPRPNRRTPLSAAL